MAPGGEGRQVLVAMWEETDVHQQLAEELPTLRPRHLVDALVGERRRAVGERGETLTNGRFVEPHHGRDGAGHRGELLEQDQKLGCDLTGPVVE